jgi:hypothetical protein
VITQDTPLETLSSSDLLSRVRGRRIRSGDFLLYRSGNPYHTVWMYLVQDYVSFNVYRDEYVFKGIEFSKDGKLNFHSVIFTFAEAIYLTNWVVLAS